jgi:hypothetical protein
MPNNYLKINKKFYDNIINKEFFSFYKKVKLL